MKINKIKISKSSVVIQENYRSNVKNNWGLTELDSKKLIEFVSNNRNEVATIFQREGIDNNTKVISQKQQHSIIASFNELGLNIASTLTAEGILELCKMIF